MSSVSSHHIDDYESFLVALQGILGVIVPEGQRSNLVGRIEPLLSSYRLDSFALLAKKLQGGDADICARVLDVISQPQSGWSLNIETRNILHEYIFGQLPDNAKIWISGCGQGQLACSVMMEIAKYEHKSGQVKNFQLIATDVLQEDVSQAELAIYNKQQLSSLHDEDKRRFFTLDEQTGTGRFKEKFQQKITFSQCDLIDDFQSLGQMDLILCPETLEYFSNGVKAGVIEQFSNLLKSGGILLTGSNQAITPFTRGFELVEHPSGVFYRQKNE